MLSGGSRAQRIGALRSIPFGFRRIRFFRREILRPSEAVAVNASLGISARGKRFFNSTDQQSSQNIWTALTLDVNPASPPAPKILSSTNHNIAKLHGLVADASLLNDKSIGPISNNKMGAVESPFQEKHSSDARNRTSSNVSGTAHQLKDPKEVSLDLVMSAHSLPWRDDYSILVVVTDDAVEISTEQCGNMILKHLYRRALLGVIGTVRIRVSSGH